MSNANVLALRDQDFFNLSISPSSELNLLDNKEKKDLAETFLDEFISQTVNRLNKSRIDKKHDLSHFGNTHDAHGRMKAFSAVKKFHRVDDYWNLVNGSQMQNVTGSSMGLNDVNKQVVNGRTAYKSSQDIRKENNNNRDEKVKKGFNNESILAHKETLNGNYSSSVDSLNNVNSSWKSNARADRINFKNSADQERFKKHIASLSDKEAKSLKDNPKEFYKKIHDHGGITIQDKRYDPNNMANAKQVIFKQDKKGNAKYNSDNIDAVSLPKETFNNLAGGKSKIKAHGVEWELQKSNKNELFYTNEKGETVKVYNSGISYYDKNEFHTMFWNHAKGTVKEIGKTFGKDILAKLISFIGVGIYAEIQRNDDVPFMTKIKRFFKAVMEFIKQEVSLKSLFSISTSVIMAQITGLITQALGLENFKIIAQGLAFAIPELSTLLIKKLKGEDISWPEFIASIFKVLSSTLIIGLMDLAESWLNTLRIPNIISIPLAIACSTLLIILSNEIIDFVTQKIVAYMPSARVALAKAKKEIALARLRKTKVEEQAKRALIEVMQKTMEKSHEESIKVLSNISNLIETKQYAVAVDTTYNTALNMGIDKSKLISSKEIDDLELDL